MCGGRARSTYDARPRNELVEVVDVMNLAGGLHRVRFPSGHDAAALSTTNGLTLRSAKFCFMTPNIPLFNLHLHHDDYHRSFRK